MRFKWIAVSILVVVPFVAISLIVSNQLVLDDPETAISQHYAWVELGDLRPPQQHRQVAAKYHAIHMGIESHFTLAGGLGAVITGLARSCNTQHPQKCYANVVAWLDVKEEEKLLFRHPNTIHPFAEASVQIRESCLGRFRYYWYELEGAVHFYIVTVYPLEGSGCSWVLGTIWFQDSLTYSNGASLLLHKLVTEGDRLLGWDISGRTGAKPILHCHGAFTAAILAIMPKTYKLRIPSIYTMHDTIYEYFFTLSKSLLENHGITTSPRNHFKDGRDYLYVSDVATRIADHSVMVSSLVYQRALRGQVGNIYGDRLKRYRDLAKAGRLHGITNGLDIRRFDFLDVRNFSFESITMGDMGAAGSTPMLDAKLAAKTWLLETSFKDLHSIIETKCWFLYIGRWGPVKSPEFIVQNLESIRSVNGLLIIITTSTDDVARLTGTRDLIILDNGKLSRELKSKIRMAADFGIIPSKREGMGLVFLEMMLFGTPVISTAVGGLEENTRARRPDIQFNSQLISQERDEIKTKFLDQKLPKDEPFFNAYVYKWNDARTFSEALKMVQSDLKAIDKAAWELLRHSLVRQAIQADWSQGKAFAEYEKIYLALSNGKG